MVTSGCQVILNVSFVHYVLEMRVKRSDCVGTFKTWCSYVFISSRFCSVNLSLIEYYVEKSGVTGAKGITSIWLQWAVAGVPRIYAYHARGFVVFIIPYTTRTSFSYTVHGSNL